MIAFLMGQAEADGVISARCNVAIGQQVAINGGPFDGLVGIIQEPPNAKGRVKNTLRVAQSADKSRCSSSVYSSELGGFRVSGGSQNREHALNDEKTRRPVLC